MILTIPVLLVAVLVAATLSALLTWIAAERRATASRNLHEAALTGLRSELGCVLTERETALATLQEAATAQTAQIAVLNERLLAEKAALENAKIGLKDAFQSAAAEALRSNNQAFLVYARQELGSQQQKASHELEKKETAITELLKPVHETLAKLEVDTRELENKRTAAYSGVEQMILGIQTAHFELRRETAMLVSALRAPKVRGNWGELQLKKCVEFAGMVNRCDFQEQVSVRDDERSQQPDMLISLPNGRVIVVDAKTPFDAFLRAMSTEEETLKKQYLAEHAKAVRHHMESLQKKAYWKQFPQSPDLIICFLPSEVLFSAALEADPGLIEFSSQSKVFLAAPTTLIPLLRSIAYGWDQKKVSENAEAIQLTGKALYKKLVNAYSQLCGVGEGLKKAGSAYDNLLGTLDGKGGFLSLSRKLEAMKLDDQELKPVQRVDYKPRPTDTESWCPDEEDLPLLLSLSAVSDKSAVD